MTAGFGTKDLARYTGSASVLVSLSHSLELYLAWALCIIFSSLAFQTLYLYESCIAGTLVSLSLHGYGTAATQLGVNGRHFPSHMFTKHTEQRKWIKQDVYVKGKMKMKYDCGENWAGNFNRKKYFVIHDQTSSVSMSSIWHINISFRGARGSKMVCPLIPSWPWPFRVESTCFPCATVRALWAVQLPPTVPSTGRTCKQI